MILCEKMGHMQLQFEGDCITIVRVAREIEVANKDFRSIILDIQHLFLTHPKWMVSYASRESNHATHALAKLAYCLSTKTIWMEAYLE